MEVSRIKPRDLLNSGQIDQIRTKNDFRNIFALIFDWGLIVLGMSIFYYYPSIFSFIAAVVVIGSRQFALAVLVHDGAHNLLFSNSNFFLKKVREIPSNKPSKILNGK